MKKLAKIMDTLEQFLTNIMNSRQEILQDFVEVITQSYLDLKEYQDNEDYKECSKQNRAINFQIEYFLCLMSDISNPNHEDANRDLLERIRLAIKKRILNTK